MFLIDAPATVTPLVVLSYVPLAGGLPAVGMLGPILAALLAFLVSAGFFCRHFLRRFFHKLRNDWRWGAASIAIVIIIGGGVMFWLRGANKPASQAKVIVIGIDGMDPKLLEEYMARGMMPYLARVRAQGFYSHLETTTPPESPVAWSTFATGANPGKHGLFDFVTRAPQTYLPDLALVRIDGSQYVSQKHGESFWSVTSAHKVPSVVLRVPITFPPEEVHGRMLSGMGVPDLRGSQGTFSYWTTEPQGPDKTMGGKVIQVNAKRDVIETTLPGPSFGQGAKRQELTLPLSIRLDRDNRRAAITLQKQTHTLQEGAWSPWYRVKFSTGFLQSVSGMVRFHLRSVTPEFALYGSPLNFDPEHPPYAISYPKQYAAQLKEAIGLYHTQGMPEDTWALNEERLDEETFLAQCRQIYQEREAMLQHELERFQEGLVVVVFDTLDRVQHMFWRAIDSEHPLYTAELHARYGTVIEEWYQRVDRTVGQVLEQLDANTILMVLSDHGFSSFRRAVHLNSWLREEGFLKLNGDLEEGRDFGMDVDWPRTQAYALGIGGIYLNLQGREPQGMVAPGESATRLKNQITARLTALIDPHNGQPVVRRVMAREEVYSGPETAHAPDLFVGFAEGYRASWQTALNGTPRAIIEDNMKKWSGDHIVDPQLVPGVLLVNRPMRLTNPRLIDIGPTILQIFGVGVPREVDGLPLWSPIAPTSQAVHHTPSNVQ